MKTNRIRYSALFVLTAIFATTACSLDKPAEPASGATSASTASTSPAGPQSSRVRYIERMLGGADTSDKVPLIIAIHGLGDRPEKFSGIFNGMSARARLILPYGLTTYGDGFSWFPISRIEPNTLAEGTSLAAKELADLIAQLEQSLPTQGRPIVTGFSQGGMLSFTLAALHPERVGEAFPIAGLLASPLFPSSWPMGKVAPPIHAFHGDADDRVPIAGARDTIRALSNVGFSATLSEYANVRHSVSDDMRRDWMAAVSAAVKRAANR